MRASESSVWSSRGLAVRKLMRGQANGLVRAVLSSTQYGILITDLQHVTLACNSQFGALFGVDYRAVVNQGVEEVRRMVRSRIINVQAWEENLKEVYSDEHSHQEDELMLRNPRMVIARATVPVLNDAGDVFARLWSFRDITADWQHRRNREALQRASLFIDAEPSRVVQFLTELIADHYEGSARVTLAQDIWIQAGSEGAGPVMRVPVLSGEGEPIGELQVDPGPHGGVLEEADQQFLRQMARRIGGELERHLRMEALQRDLEATQQSLIQSEKLAVTGTLAAGISHDIRNILSSISLALETNPAESPGLQEAIQPHLDRFHLLSHRLLSFVKPASLAHEPVDLEEVLRRVSLLLEAQLRSAGCRLELDYPPDLHEIQADPLRMDHLLINLVMNAVQAYEGRPGVVTVTILQDGQSTSILVSDQGKGLPTNGSEDLFKPFVSRRTGGTGLGLFSCRQIALELGGTIVGQNLPEGGALFKVELPR